jgi:hypothetical protein
METVDLAVEGAVEVMKVDAYHVRLSQAGTVVACETLDHNLPEIGSEKDNVAEVSGFVSNSVHPTTVHPENRISDGTYLTDMHLDDACLLTRDHSRECPGFVVA